MIDILEAGQGTKLVYLTVDEQKLKRKLIGIRRSYSRYYRNGRLIGRAWVLPKETAKRLGLTK